VTSRQFAEAERILERIKQKMHVSDRNRGYFQALYGMLLTQKNSDRYAFLPAADLTKKKDLKKYRKEFLSHVDSRLHDEYDRGFFEAWADYMRILPRLQAPTLPVNNFNKKAVKEETEATETLREETEEAMNEDQETEREPSLETEKEERAEAPADVESVKASQSVLIDFAK
jgi:hypothetical protein